MAALVYPTRLLKLTKTAIKISNHLVGYTYIIPKILFTSKANTAKNFEPLFVGPRGPPRRAERKGKWSGKPMGGALRRPRKSRENPRRSNNGVFIRLCSNSFYQKFLKKPVPAAAGGGQEKTHWTRRLRRRKGDLGKGNRPSRLYEKVRRRRTKFGRLLTRCYNIKAWIFF